MPRPGEKGRLSRAEGAVVGHPSHRDLGLALTLRLLLLLAGERERDLDAGVRLRLFDAGLHPAKRNSILSQPRFGWHYWGSAAHRQCNRN